MPEEQQERFPQASFMSTSAAAWCVRIFSLYSTVLLLLYHAYAITDILYVAYSSSFVVRGSEQPGRDTLEIYTST